MVVRNRELTTGNEAPRRTEEERIVTREVEVGGPSPAGAPLCVLVISSRSSDVTALRQLLSRDQREIEFASHGLEAMRLTDLLKPDLVLCDLQLPGTPSAYAVAQALRSDPSLGHVYLVGLTRVAGTAVEQGALRAGFDRVLSFAEDALQIEAIIQERW
jgi:CheY-like chemotaxis protein